MGRRRLCDRSVLCHGRQERRAGYRLCDGAVSRATGTRGGWGIAENAGKPYFITAVSGNAYCSGPTAANATSTTELVHVVAVYDYENKLQHLYINGVAEGTGQAITGEFARQQTIPVYSISSCSVRTPTLETCLTFQARI